MKPFVQYALIGAAVVVVVRGDPMAASAGKGVLPPASIPGGGTEISKQALTFTEQNMRAAFEHARKLVHATDLQEAMRIQSDFLRSQFTNAGEHMRQITGAVMSTAKDATKGKF